MDKDLVNRLIIECHQECLDAGWWDNGRSTDTAAMLIISELSEALEGDRKNLMDDKLPHRPMAEVELADAFLRCLDLMGRGGLIFSPMTLPGIYFEDPFPDSLFIITRTVCHYHLNRAANQIIKLCEYHEFDLERAVFEKREYNKHRADHKPENRLKPNGKRY